MYNPTAMPIKDFYKNLLIRIINPYYWIKIHPTNKSLDNIINNLINNNAPVILSSEYSIVLGNLLLWAENYPYGYGSISDNPYTNLRIKQTYNIDILNDNLDISRNESPRMVTIIRLKKYVDKYIKENYSSV